ncbi:hypothetical protein AAG612_09970 [Citromicrobium bathyomarinum]|uniref:DUF6961 family protein n=1 Tax=Citromicrobium bathyomarinum TaxID=72174 RepID=UPI00315A6D9E
MSPTREQELWALILWVEKHHGEDGTAYITERIGHFTATDESGGVELWEGVEQRFARLTVATEDQPH